MPWSLVKSDVVYEVKIAFIYFIFFTIVSDIS